MSAFIVRGYDARGTLLLATTHESEASAAIEIDVWQTRMNKAGDPAARAELIDCRIDGKLTDTKVYAHTQIPWSWTR